MQPYQRQQSADQLSTHHLHLLFVLSAHYQRNQRYEQTCHYDAIASGLVSVTCDGYCAVRIRQPDGIGPIIHVYRPNPVFINGYGFIILGCLRPPDLIGGILVGILLFADLILDAIRQAVKPYTVPVSQ